MNKTITYLILICFSIAYNNTVAFQEDRVINYNNSNDIVRAGKYLSILEDKTNLLEIQDVISLNTFTPSNQEIPSFGISESTFWAKLTINNNTDIEHFILEFEKITAQTLTLYYKENINNNKFTSQNISKGSKKYAGRLFILDFNIPKDKQSTIYLKFKTSWSSNFPIKIGTRDKILHRLFNEELIGGIYIGILFIMVFYNMFIYFSIKDKSYIYYVIYIFSFLLFQFNEMGYAYKYLWYLHPEQYSIAAKVLPTITTITAIIFVRDFLKTKTYSPKLDKIFNLFLIALTSMFFLVFNEAYNSIYFSVINILTLVISLYTLAVAIYIVWIGFTPAKFFLIAWSVLLLSIIQFNLSNLGFIPYYTITDHSLEIGSTIEIVLLSLGLAYRINVLKREKESSQAEALILVKEKKNIIENQNYVLENLVSERTKKLELRNEIITKKNEEKSIMMREIHHRVKNNLQMINSMVRLQSRSLDKENAKDSLKEVERRIQTMALLHEKMYQSENLASINIKDYIVDVLNDLLMIYKGDKNITYKLDITKVNFNTETMLFIGLLINELITNALKHAFKAEENGHISICLLPIENNMHQLIIKNNGAKINIEAFNNSKSLGQRLIKNFVKQLNGSLTINNTPNTCFTILFKEI